MDIIGFISSLVTIEEAGRGWLSGVFQFRKNENAKKKIAFAEWDAGDESSQRIIDGFKCSMAAIYKEHIFQPDEIDTIVEEFLKEKAYLVVDSNQKKDIRDFIYRTFEKYNDYTRSQMTIGERVLQDSIKETTKKVAELQEKITDIEDVTQETLRNTEKILNAARTNISAPTVQEQEQSNESQKNGKYQCDLFFTTEGMNPKLTDNSIEELKKLYRSFKCKGAFPVEVNIRIQDVDVMAQQIAECNEAFILYNVKQSLLKRMKKFRKVLNKAVEYCLQDEAGYDYPIQYHQKLIDYYGIENCRFTDSEGIDYYYWKVFYWITVIEEMLKEITFESGRDFYYTSSKNPSYRKVDLLVRDRKHRILWDFSSYLLIDHLSKSYKEIEKILYTNFKGDFCDIPVEDLAFRIYPDLYFGIGKIQESEPEKYNELYTIKGIFNLLYYEIGLH